MTEGNVTYNRNQTIILPNPEQEKVYAIRFQDWDRCLRKLRKMKQQTPRFHLIYSFFFGVGASALSALITTYSQPAANLASWVVFVYWALLGVGLIVGSLFVYVDKVFRGEQQTDVKDMIEDMESIEKTFPPTSVVKP